MVRFFSTPLFLLPSRDAFFRVCFPQIRTSTPHGALSYVKKSEVKAAPAFDLFLSLFQGISYGKRSQTVRSPVVGKYKVVPTFGRPPGPERPSEGDAPHMNRPPLHLSSPTFPPVALTPAFDKDRRMFRSANCWSLKAGILTPTSSKEEEFISMDVFRPPPPEVPFQIKRALSLPPRTVESQQGPPINSP